MGRVCFVDNDVILKLAACGLFWEAIAALECEPTQVNVLSSAKFMFRRDSSIQDRYGKLVCDQAIAITEQCQPVRNQPDNPYLNRSFQNVDIGELVLIFEAMSCPDFILTTGDKRFLKALSQTPELKDIYQAVMGQIVCFEQVIAQLIRVNGFETVREAVIPARECDTALKAAFGSGQLADLQNVAMTLNAYIAEIQSMCPGLLAELS